MSQSQCYRSLGDLPNDVRTCFMGLENKEVETLTSTLLPGIENSAFLNV